MMEKGASRLERAPPKGPWPRAALPLSTPRIQHARIRDRHSETVCLLLQAIESADHFTHISSAVAGICHLILQKPQCRRCARVSFLLALQYWGASERGVP